jgi:omega-amidase
MKVALISLNQAWEDKELNWKSCEKYIDKAYQANVELIIFPEMTLTGFSLNIEKNSEYRSNSNTLARFKQKSKENKIAIIFGMLVEEDGFFYNKSFFISSHGVVIGEYAKIHTFSFAGEGEYINSGNKLVVVQYKNINIGMSICYDLRFPELFSALGKKSNLIVNIANWPKKRCSHWIALLKSRAIENQVYVAGINRVGADGNQLKYVESSLIFDANGDLVKSQSADEKMTIYKIDGEKQKEYRKGFPTIKDRRVELYKDIL